MLWGELPSSLEGTEQQAQSSALQWAPFLWQRGLCSAWKQEKCRMHLLRERAAQIQNPGKTQGFGGTAGYLEETQQNQCNSCLAKEQRRSWSPYLSFPPWKNVIFFQSHGCILGRTKDNAKCQLISWQESSWQWTCSHLSNLASSCGSPVAQTHVSVRVHASLETIPSPNPQPWHHRCSDLQQLEWQRLIPG